MILYWVQFVINWIVTLFWAWPLTWGLVYKMSTIPPSPPPPLSPPFSPSFFCFIFDFLFVSSPNSVMNAFPSVCVRVCVRDWCWTALVTHPLKLIGRSNSCNQQPVATSFSFLSCSSFLCFTPSFVPSTPHWSARLPGNSPGPGIQRRAWEETEEKWDDW